MKLENQKISLIMPVNNCLDQLIFLLKQLKSQTLKPSEIIIVDSSNNLKISNYISTNNFIFKIIYKKLNNSYPGKSRNYGFNYSRYSFIALLDVKTIPINNWLETYIKYLNKNEIGVIFGCTKYEANTYKSKLIQGATFGNINHETTPGTLVKREIFNKFLFIENVRSGDDLEWRIKIKKNAKTFTPNNFFLNYKFLPNSFLTFAFKYFIYALHNSRVNVQKNIKDLYLAIFIIFLSLFIPRWNYLIGNWNDNPLYLPNITKYYFLILIIFFILINIFNIEYRKKFFFSKYIIKLIVFIFFSIGIYKWNSFVIHIIENTIFYIPHITKLYLVFLAITSILYRGLYLPINRNISLKFLFPFNFILIGFYGLTLDLIKAPGYIFGSIFNFLKFKKI